MENGKKEKLQWYWGVDSTSQDNVEENFNNLWSFYVM
jgi:hypothetical protein